MLPPNLTALAQAFRRCLKRDPLATAIAEVFRVAYWFSDIYFRRSLFFLR